jgi:hypothetical protein
MGIGNIGIATYINLRFHSVELSDNHARAHHEPMRALVLCFEMKRAFWHSPRLQIATTIVDNLPDRI